MMEAKEMARISKFHYDYANTEDPKAFEASIALPDWTIQHELSNRDLLVLDNQNKRVISLKGTDLKNPNDIISDIALATGLQKSNKQFIERKNQIKNIMRADNDKEYYLTGHSLGSSILVNALTSSPSILRKTKKAYIFNQGSTPLFESSLNPRKENITMLEEKIKNYKHTNDPISKYAGKFGEVYMVRTNKKGLNAHSILNFT